MTFSVRLVFVLNVLSCRFGAIQNYKLTTLLSDKFEFEISQSQKIRANNFTQILMEALCEWGIQKHVTSDE